MVKKKGWNARQADFIEDVILHVDVIMTKKQNDLIISKFLQVKNLVPL